MYTADNPEFDNGDTIIPNKRGYLTECQSYKLLLSPILRTLFTVENHKAALGVLYRTIGADGNLYPVARGYPVGLN